MNNIPESQLHPALIDKQSRKLKFGQYTYIGDENPERIYRQRTAGNVSGNRISFRTHPPVPNLLLSSKAWIKYSFSLSKFKDDAPVVAEDYQATDNTAPTQGDVILTKPFMAVANATTEAFLSINGKGITYSEPRYFQKYMGQLFCPNEDIKKYFSTCGGPFPSSSGAYDDEAPRIDIANGADGDEEFDAAADLTFEQYATSTGANNIAVINFYEPIYIGPFNWGYDMKERLPDNFWGKKMSNLIPYVRDLEYRITVDKLAANCFYYHYGQTSGPGNEEVFLTDSGMQSAELVLQWIKPKDLEIIYEKPYPNTFGIGTTMLDSNSKTVSIPEEVRLQSWYHQHKVFNVNDGAVAPDGLNFTVDIPVINMYQVPSYILMFATVDKDDNDYTATAATFSDNTALNPGTSFDSNSIETNPAIRSMNIDINSDKQVISDRYNSRELYNITLKNAKKDYPHDFAKYLGGLNRRANYPGNTCVLLSSDDLNIPMTTGRLTNDFTFAANVRLRTRTGLYIKNSSSDLIYRLHVFFLYDKYYMKINSKGDVDWRYESVY